MAQSDGIPNYRPSLSMQADGGLLKVLDVTESGSRSAIWNPADGQQALGFAAATVWSKFRELLDVLQTETRSGCAARKDRCFEDEVDQ
jgi:hypothetical protein